MSIIGGLEKYLAGIFIKIGGELEIVKDNKLFKVEHPSQL